MDKPRVLLIITGSIAAFKALELVRLLAEKQIHVTVVMTKAAEKFVTPLSAASLSGHPVYTDMFSLKDEVEMGHIRLSREADLVLVAPASADVLAKMAHGLADDLASTLLLATNRPVIAVPAMNYKMWEHKAVQRNIKQIKKDGVILIEPEEGALACGEVGQGRMASPEVIVQHVEKLWMDGAVD